MRSVTGDTSTERPTDIANRAKFDRFITANLLPWLRAKLGGLPEPKNVVIAGFSVGGLTGAYVAHRHPDVFGNVLARAAHSGEVHRNMGGRVAVISRAFGTSPRRSNP